MNQKNKHRSTKDSAQDCLLFRDKVYKHQFLRVHNSHLSSSELISMNVHCPDSATDVH